LARPPAGPPRLPLAGQCFVTIPLQQTAAAAAEQTQVQPERLSWKVKILYGAPSFAGAALVIPILVNMPKFYADVVLVPLGYLALAIAMARSLDALSDPIVGWLSDRTRTRLGRRRPYLIFGAPVCGLAFWAMLSPPQWLSGNGAALWFALTFTLYFIFHTIYALPHYALGPELTLDYHERSSLFGVREAFTILGTIVAAAAPGVMMKLFGWNERQAFSAIGVTFAIMLTALYWLLAWQVRERPEFSARESNPFVPGVRRALRNRPFIILLASYVVASITGAIPATLLPFFNAYVLQPKNPDLWLSLELLGYFGVGFLCLPLWVGAAHRFGKLPTWLASFIMNITGGGAMFFLGKGDTAGLMVLICWSGAAFGAGLFLSPSMQADVIDYDEFHTGKRREAQYTAFWSILPKFVAIPSAVVPIAVLGQLGYVPNAVQTPEVILAIKAMFALLPAFCAMLSFALAWQFPITETIHRAILDGIARHERGLDAIDPLTGARIAPPHAGAVDEATGWFLDNFSAGELRRHLGGGRSPLLRDVIVSAASAIAVSIAAASYAISCARAPGTDPGALASLSVVVAGFALAVFVFHVLRIGAALRLIGGAVPASTIRTYLDRPG
jgi:GPH family glycoside/pentoside/hexuronide:cation symporter